MKKIIAAVLLLLGSVAAANATIYTPVGPQTNVAVADVLNGGWTMVYSATMGTPIGTDPANSIMSAYKNDLVMLAGRAVGSDTFTVLAEASYADVFFNTNNLYGVNTTHNANGSEWYYTPGWSWGFAESGASVNLYSADVAAINDPLRMSIHTVGVGGFRIGTTFGLNYSSDWEKDILVFNGAAPVPEPGTMMLLGAGFLGLAIFGKRRKNA